MKVPEGGLLGSPQGHVRLFHGTSKEKACKILRDGFSPLSSSRSGPSSHQCFWLTTDIREALMYGDAVVMVEISLENLENMGCKTRAGARKDFDHVSCCEWSNDNVLSMDALGMVGSIYMGNTVERNFPCPCNNNNDGG